MGLLDEANRVSPMPEGKFSLMKGKVPSRQALVAVFPRPIDFWSTTEGGMIAQRLMLNAGRGPDYLYFYDRAFSSPEAMAAQHP